MHDIDQQQIERICGLTAGAEIPQGVRDVYSQYERARCRISHTGPMPPELLLVIAVSGGGIDSPDEPVTESRWRSMEFGANVVIRSNDGTHDYATGTLVGMATGAQKGMVEVAVHGDQDSRRSYPEWRVRLPGEEPQDRPVYEDERPRSESQVGRRATPRKPVTVIPDVDDEAEAEAKVAEPDAPLEDDLPPPSPLARLLSLRDLRANDPVFLELDDGSIVDGLFVTVGSGDRQFEARVKIVGQRGSGRYYPGENVTPNRVAITELREQEQAEQEQAEQEQAAQESEVDERAAELAEV